MVHQKTARGQAAIRRLSTFEGIPHPYDQMKRKVIPSSCDSTQTREEVHQEGDMANLVGWEHQELVDRLEDKRRAKSDVFYQKKKATVSLRVKAEEAAAGELTKINEVLAAAGY